MRIEPPIAVRAVRCWVLGRRVCLELADQRQISFLAEKFPRLAGASDAKLAKVSLQLDGRALRWDEVDEDIWVEDVLAGKFPQERGG